MTAADTLAIVRTGIENGSIVCVDTQHMDAIVTLLAEFDRLANGSAVREARLEAKMCRERAAEAEANAAETQRIAKGMVDGYREASDIWKARAEKAEAALTSRLIPPPAVDRDAARAIGVLVRRLGGEVVISMREQLEMESWVMTTSDELDGAVTLAVRKGPPNHDYLAPAKVALPVNRCGDCESYATGPLEASRGECERTERKAYAGDPAPETGACRFQRVSTPPPLSLAALASRLAVVEETLAKGRTP